MPHSTLLHHATFAILLTTSVAASAGPRAHGRPIVVREQQNQVLHYRLKLQKRDSSGAYDWVGDVDGFVNGHATVTLRYQSAAPIGNGAFPVETHWHVTGATNSDSLEATLSGALIIPSGKTHLIGAIIRGAGRGQMVETRSQITNLGVAGTVSNCDGTITIYPPVAAAQ